MIGDLWEAFNEQADAVLIPTNCQINARNQLVMGRGVAVEAKERFPELPKYFGKAVQAQRELCLSKGFEFGVYHSQIWLVPVKILQHAKYQYAVHFPTKIHWTEDSNLELIGRSAKQVKTVADHLGWTKIVLPAVGSGLGRLPWDQVQSVLEQYFDNRFIVCFKP